MKALFGCFAACLMLSAVSVNAAPIEVTDAIGRKAGAQLTPSP